MAMFKFEQLENNIFYFTDTIPETKKLVNFLNINPQEVLENNFKFFKM